MAFRRSNHDAQPSEEYLAKHTSTNDEELPFNRVNLGNSVDTGTSLCRGSQVKRLRDAYDKARGAEKHLRRVRV